DVGRSDRAKNAPVVASLCDAHCRDVSNVHAARFTEARLQKLPQLFFLLTLSKFFIPLLCFPCSPCDFILRLRVCLNKSSVHRPNPKCMAGRPFNLVGMC